MLRKDVNARSPLRVLEQSIHGGLGRGNLGVVIARHGVGKTAFLVGVALDDLMRGRKVLHVSAEHGVDKVIAFYDEIFADVAHEGQLEDVWRVRTDVDRHRRIHCFPEGTFSVTRLRQALEFMRANGDFIPAAIVIDGVDFAQLGAFDLKALREMATEADAELWMSAVTHREAVRDEHGIPDPVARLQDHIDVILTMAGAGRHVHVALCKDHDNPNVSELKVALDPRTMLLVAGS